MSAVCWCWLFQSKDLGEKLLKTRLHSSHLVWTFTNTGPNLSCYLNLWRFEETSFNPVKRTHTFPHKMSLVEAKFFLNCHKKVQTWPQKSRFTKLSIKHLIFFDTLWCMYFDFKIGIVKNSSMVNEYLQRFNYWICDPTDQSSASIFFLVNNQWKWKMENKWETEYFGSEKKWRGSKCFGEAPLKKVRHDTLDIHFQNEFSRFSVVKKFYRKVLDIFLPQTIHSIKK